MSDRVLWLCLIPLEATLPRERHWLQAEGEKWGTEASPLFFPVCGTWHVVWTLGSLGCTWSLVLREEGPVCSSPQALGPTATESCRGVLPEFTGACPASTSET